MKLNISYPLTGLQKVIEVDDEKKLRAFYDKRMSHELDGIEMGEEFKGYIFRISGGNDKQGFPMKQGVLTSQRVAVLMDKGASCFRPRRRGERKRKSVRGCIVSSELSVINLVVVKKGEQEIAGLTDGNKPRRRGPKRATRIRKLFNLDKKDDVRKVVIRRQIVKDGKKPYTKAPKIQRLVTPRRLQHRRQLRAERRQRYEKSRQEAKEYVDLLTKRAKETREEAKLSKKRSHSRRESAKAEASKLETKEATKPTAKATPAKSDAKPAAAKPAATGKKQEAKSAAAAKPATAGGKKQEAKSAAAAKPATGGKQQEAKSAAAKPATAGGKKQEAKSAAAAKPATGGKQQEAKSAAAKPATAGGKKQEAKSAAAKPAAAGAKQQEAKQEKKKKPKQ